MVLWGLVLDYVERQSRLRIQDLRTLSPSVSKAQREAESVRDKSCRDGLAEPPEWS